MNNIFTTNETEPHSLQQVAELAVLNRYQNLQDGDLIIYDIIQQDGTVLGLGKLNLSDTLDLLEYKFPNGIPEELISNELALFLAAECTCDEPVDSPEPEHKPVDLKEIINKIDSVVLNRFGRDNQITAESTRVLLDLAALRSKYMGFTRGQL